MSYLLEDLEKWARESDYAKLNRYFQNHPDKALAALSETKDTVKWAGTSAKHLSKKMLRKKKSAEQEKTAAPKVGLDGFYDIEDTEFKKKYNSHSEAPVGRIYHNPNLPKIQMRHKKDDPSRFEIFLKDRAEQEKTAAPMFGKKRYKPRTEADDRLRAYDRLVEHERKKDNHDPSYNRKSHQEDIEAYDKATQAFDDMVERNKQTTAFRRKHITIPTAASAMIAADALKTKAEGDRSSAKGIGIAAGLVGAYPAFQGARIGVKELKNRYHWSKQENIDKDRAEREKDQDVYDRAYKPWFASRGNERLGK